MNTCNRLGLSYIKHHIFYHDKRKTFSKKLDIKDGFQNVKEEQGETQMKIQLEQFQVSKEKSTTESKCSFRQSDIELNATFSTKNTSVVLTRNSIKHNDTGERNSSIVPHCDKSDSHPVVLIRNEEQIADVYVGHIDIQNVSQTTDSNETDENDDEGFASKDKSNSHNFDIESTLHMEKTHPLIAFNGRSCQPIPTDITSPRKVQHTESSKSPGITNIEVLKGFVHDTLDNLEVMGCFKEPPKSRCQHVLYPQKQEFRMPPLTPIPIYPNDKNEQIHTNPLSLLNTYRRWSNDLQISTSALARAGFHSVSRNDQRVGCRSCGIELHIDAFQGSDPCTIHRRLSPLCPVMDREGSVSTVIQQETTPNPNEVDYLTMQRLQLAPSSDNPSDANGADQIETINEEQRHRNERYNIQSDGIQASSASATSAAAAAAAAAQQSVITYQPRNPGLVSSESRQQSFRNWPGAAQDIDNLVQAGFFFTGEDDVVRCFHCDIGLAEWDPSDDPWVEHARHSPDCPFLKNHRDTNFITNIQRQWAQIYTPKHPHQSQLRTRLESYDPSWPRDFVIQSPEQLAEAGFFYTGVTDTVRCHYCDGGLREWEPDDDPWTEHARWFPFCKFVIKVKGLSFIQAAAAVAEDNNTELDNPTGVTSPPVHVESSFEEKCRKRDLENPMLSAAVESVKALGYKKKMIKKAILVHIETSGKREFSAGDLMEILFKMEEKESSLEADGSESCSSSDEISLTPKAIAMENEYLKKRQRCYLCRTRETCMLFIPCGHRITCEPCGKSQTLCSVCGKEVTSCVKTFLG